MDFEWDQKKSDACFDDRGFDFAYVTAVFLDRRRLERVDDRKNYGETRFQTIGQISGKTYFVVYTVRRKRIRIISARRANAEEERAYRESLPRA